MISLFSFDMKNKSILLIDNKIFIIVFSLKLNNKLIKINKKLKYEKLFRDDYKYNYILPINYNTKKTILGKGSAIFIHLTKNFKPTAGCIAIQKKDLLILLKLINKKTKIKIT